RPSSSTPAICARACTRKRSPPKTSRTARCQRSRCPLLALAVRSGSAVGHRRAVRRSEGGRPMAAAGLMAEVELPDYLEATEPPEARGLRRDEVRLLVSDIARDSIEHARFLDLPQWLAAGDLLVVNTSATLKAAVEARSESGEARELHVSTQLPGGYWTVEVRRPGSGASLPDTSPQAGTTFLLPAGGQATLLAPYPLTESLRSPSRLWIA